MLQPIGKNYGALVGEVAKTKERAGESPLKEQIDTLHQKLEAFANPADVREGDKLDLDALKKIERLFDVLQAVDAGPTPQQQAAVTSLQRDAQSVQERWKAIPREVAVLNTTLQAAGIEKLKVP